VNKSTKTSGAASSKLLWLAAVIFTLAALGMAISGIASNHDSTVWLRYVAAGLMLLAAAAYGLSALKARSAPKA
jgi:ABC-type nickel/cobalt efflux system permease component RcnA